MKKSVLKKIIKEAISEALVSEEANQFETWDLDDFADKNVSAWVNGNKIVDIDKSPINVKFIPSAIFFKHGVYRSFISKYKASHSTDVMPTQIVYYDEVRRGSSIDEVDFNINPNLEIVD